jgi:hypothetical protein
MERDTPSAETWNFPGKTRPRQIVVDLGLIYNVTSVMVVTNAISYDMTVSVGALPGPHPSSFPDTCTPINASNIVKGGPVVSEPLELWDARYFGTANCTGFSGRYLSIAAFGKNVPVYEVFVNGASVGAITPPALNRWSRAPPPITDTGMSEEDYKQPLPGYYRVYGSVDAPFAPGMHHSRYGTVLFPF